jgi:predicted metal-binding protein
MTLEDVLQAAQEIGFSHCGKVTADHLDFLPEVREMCAANRCNSYGKSWTCPPHCGTPEEISARAAQYHIGVLIQSTGEMEDDFDVECMMETEQRHKAHFDALVSLVRQHWPNCLPMAAGTCTRCRPCTCPDAPCRFPDLAVPSMEAYGLLVSDVCQKAGLPYYYGKQTITYTSCILLE